MHMNLETLDRSPAEIIRRQHETLAALPLVREFLDAIPNMTLVLNEHRQIVYGNRAFADFLGLPDGLEPAGGNTGEIVGGRFAGVLGQRPGEAVGCIRAHLTRGGCGTSKFCQTCGAVLSILNCQMTGRENVQECRMMRGQAGTCEGALDLRVWSRLIHVGDEVFTVFSLMDISNEKRRAVMERIFFHDVLNTAGCVKGMSDLMRQTKLPEAELREVLGLICDSADQLVEEIGAQQSLTAAESGELKPELTAVNAADMLGQVVRQFQANSLTRDKKLEVAAGAENYTLVTDAVLLRRVLVNLVKNALEAEPAGAVIKLYARLQNDRVSFTVHNPSMMPPDVQLQIFMRSFSTKGSGHGLGTHSVKLLSEKFLGGKVWFVSSANDGTRFTVSLPRQD